MKELVVKKIMVKKLVILSVVLISIEIHARGLVLDCESQVDDLEANICSQSVAKTCPESASRAVAAVNRIRSGKNIVVHTVEEIQRDVSYDVGFSYEGQEDEIIFKNMVFVEALSESCRVKTVDY